MCGCVCGGGGGGDMVLGIILNKEHLPIAICLPNIN